MAILTLGGALSLLFGFSAAFGDRDPSNSTPSSTTDFRTNVRKLRPLSADDITRGGCSAAWCTSPDGQGGYDCWAGSPIEPCMCTRGKARLTGKTHYDHVLGVNIVEYTCCTEDLSADGVVGENCYLYSGYQDWQRECSTTACTSEGNDCLLPPSGEHCTCSGGLKPRATGKSMDFSMIGAGVLFDYTCCPESNDTIEAGDCEAGLHVSPGDNITGMCSMEWCTSPLSGKNDGYDCWAGSPIEPCTCARGKARLTGKTHYAHDLGVNYVEYTCCTEDLSADSVVGENCGEYSGYQDWQRECSTTACTSWGNDCVLPPSGEHCTCSGGLKPRATGKSMDLSMMGMGVVHDYMCCPESSDTIEAWDCRRGVLSASMRIAPCMVGAWLWMLFA